MFDRPIGYRGLDPDQSVLVHSGEIFIDGKLYDGHIGINAGKLLVELRSIEFPYPLNSFVLGYYHRNDGRVSILSFLRVTEVDRENIPGNFNILLSCHSILTGPSLLDFNSAICKSVAVRFTDISDVIPFNGCISLISRPDKGLRDHIRETAGTDIAEGEIVKLAVMVAQRTFFNASSSEVAVRGGSTANIVEATNRIEWMYHPYLHISFRSPLDMNNVLWKVNNILQFFSLICGRPQHVEGMQLLMDEKGVVTPFDVLLPPRAREVAGARPRISSRAMLVNPILDRTKFEKVFENWITTYSDWREARYRLSEIFEKEAEYGPSRLVMAANMFEISPDYVKPSTSDVPNDIAEIITEARVKLKSLKDTFSRRQAYDALNLITKVSLRQTVFERIRVIPKDELNKYAPNVRSVIVEANKMRNRFVHGKTAKSFPYEDKVSMVFFTLTLEFIFMCADLVQLGWSLAEWIESSTETEPRHPMRFYIDNYAGWYESFGISYEQIYGKRPDIISP